LAQACEIWGDLLWNAPRALNAPGRRGIMGPPISRRRLPDRAHVSVLALATVLFAAAVATTTGSAFVAVAPLPPRSGGLSKPAAPTRTTATGSMRSPGSSTATALRSLGCAALFLGAIAAGRTGSASSAKGRKIKVRVQALAPRSYTAAVPAAGPQQIQIQDLLDMHVIVAPAAVTHDLTSFMDGWSAAASSPLVCAAVDEAAPAFGCSAAPRRRLAAARRVGSARRAQRSGRRASTQSCGASRSQRRHVGSKLEVRSPFPETAPAPFDVSRTRAKIQLGLRSSASPRSDRRRETRTISCNEGINATTESCVAGYSFVKLQHIMKSSLDPFGV